MPTLSESTIAELFSPYLVASSGLIPKLSDYLDLLVRWNTRTNLTAIRTPEEMVRRHFGESLFAGMNLANLFLIPCWTWDQAQGFPGFPSRCFARRSP